MMIGVAGGNVNHSALLIDVDSTIPNLALMHISTWKKQEGYDVGWGIKNPNEVYASIVFKKNRNAAVLIKALYPTAQVDIGGSGIDLVKKLPDEVDLMMPDYSLYPAWHSDLGFTSRGCGRSCYFCIVPKKEGKFKINQHPKDFHDRTHKSIVLMDNNILWDKDWFLEVTDWIIQNNLKVDFNQGLDLRLMDKDIAKRISELKPIDSWHFAFDSMDYKDSVISGLKLLKDAGVNIRTRCNVYVYLHNDEQTPDALERCEILRNIGTLPYIMVNRDTPRTHRMTDLKRWTRPQIFFSTDFKDYKKGLRGVV